MTILQAIFLGIVQGVTEFLPISSSGHLAIFQNIFGIETNGGILFEVMLHVGTLVTICIVYKKDILRMIRETILICMDIIFNVKIFISNRRYDEALRYRRIVRNNYRKFVVLIIVSTIPTALIGYSAKGIIEFVNSTLVIPGVCLLLTGVLLLIADISEEGHKKPKDVDYGNGFFIGIAQGLATLPGLSRSGTTITACLLSGFDRRFAVKYSFIMSIPAILGAAILELKDIGQEVISVQFVMYCIIGAIFAAVVGFICMKTMLLVVRKKKFKGFAIYCFIVGTIAIIAHLVI